MKNEIGFVIRNNQTMVVCDSKQLATLRKHFRVRAPGAFYSPAFRQRRWDGFIYYINKTGFIQTGLLPEFITFCINNKWQYEIEDERQPVKPGKLKHDHGTFKLRGYQFQAVKAFKYNAIRDRRSKEFPFQRGILQATTNAGKTAISASLATLYGKKTIYLINRKEYYDEALPMFQKYLPGKVGYINSKGIEWNDFMVCMVPTIHARLPYFEGKLAQFEIVIVDECDMATSKMWQNVLQRFYNAPIRAGLSGTAQVGVLKKDEIKNRQIREFFGEIIYEISGSDLEAKGFSSPIDMEILAGNTTVNYPKDFVNEYTEGIIKNKARNVLIKNLVRKHALKSELPILIITKLHDHVARLHKRLKANLGLDFRIESVHHKTPNRPYIVKQFAEGKIDILVASMILARAKNFPLMQVMINAGAGDSVRNALQMVGRARRTHESKTKTFYYDFFDMGSYLQRHSKHRLFAYRKEKLEPKETYKTIINNAKRK